MEPHEIELDQLIFVGNFDLSDKLNPRMVIELLKKYYDKNYKVKDIMKLYNLDISSLNFAKYLPYFRTNKKCIYDKAFMIRKLPSRSGASYESRTYKCPECHHIESSEFSIHSNCNCDNCIQSKQKQESQKAERLLKRKKRIEDSILFSRRYWKYEELRLEDRVTLATILQKTQTKFNECILPYEDYDIDDMEIHHDLINDLLQKGVLSIDTSSPLDAFDELDEGIRYYFNAVKFMISLEYVKEIPEEDQFDRLKYPNYNDLAFHNKKEINQVWRKYATRELLNFLNKFLSEFKFGDKKKNTTDIKQSSILRWLENYTPAQIYSAMWAGIRNANTQRTQNTMGKFVFHPVNFVILKIDEYMGKKSYLEDYDYPKNQAMPLSTKIFFESILKETGWFKTRVPEENSSKSEINCYQVESQQFEEQEKRLDMFEIDTEKIKGIVSNSLEYNILPIGISILDFNGKQYLYTDELTLWKISNSTDILPVKEMIEYEGKDYWIDCIFNLKQILELFKGLSQADLK